MKDHEIGLVINQLRDTARKYAETQQLRERLHEVIMPYFRRLQKAERNVVIANEIAEMEQEKSDLFLNTLVTITKELDKKDRARIDWIAQQGDKFQSGLIQDAGNDGHYFVMCIAGYFHGRTFREAIDIAMGAG